MEIIQTSSAPPAIGPYSQAIKINGFIFCSGQIPLNKDGVFVEGDITIQTRQVLENLKAVVETSGSSLDKVVKTTIYLVDLSMFQAMNDVYSEFFGRHKPARATVQVSALPKGALVEIEAVAMV
jgi:2-iminobutanoate/2-iminopropanoate deaminase